MKSGKVIWGKLRPGSLKSLLGWGQACIIDTVADYHLYARTMIKRMETNKSDNL